MDISMEFLEALKSPTFMVGGVLMLFVVYRMIRPKYPVATALDTTMPCEADEGLPDPKALMDEAEIYNRYKRYDLMKEILEKIESEHPGSNEARRIHDACGSAGMPLNAIDYSNTAVISALGAGLFI